MGCGASSDAAAVGVVPEAAGTGTTASATPSQRTHKVKVSVTPASPLPNSKAAHSSATAAAPATPSQLPAGLSSFKNSPQVASVRRASVMAAGAPASPAPGEELPPLKGKLLSPGGTASMSGNHSSAPTGSQIPGLNYCSADFFPTHMEQCWGHYARPPDYKLIDKAGLKLMAEDAVNSFNEAARKSIVADNPKWKEDKIEAKLAALRAQFLPGAKHDDTLVIATHFLAHELKYTAGDGDGKASGVTKPCFFLHFQRAHRMLFSFTGGQDITLERELIVQRLNKQGQERANRGLKSLTAKSAGGASSGLLSSKATKSVKASARHKSAKKDSKGGKPKAENMFGQLDFGAPSGVPEDGEKSISQHKQ